MVGLDTSRTASEAPPLAGIAEDMVEGDEDVVVFFVAHGKLLFRYPVHNPFSADVGQRSTTATTTTSSSAAPTVSSTTTAPNGTNATAYATTNQGGSTAAPSTTASGALPPPRPSPKRTSPTTAKTPRAQAEASTAAAATATTAAGTAKGRAVRSSSSSTTAAESTGAKGSPLTTSAETAVESSCSPDEPPSEPAPMSRKERRRQKALKKAAEQGGDGPLSQRQMKRQAKNAVSPSPPPPPHADTTSGALADRATKAAPLASQPRTVASTSDLTRVGVPSPLEQSSPTLGCASIASPSAGVGVLSKRKRTAHTQEPATTSTATKENAVPSPAVVSATATASSAGTATATASAVPGVAPQRGLRRPVSFANLAAAEKSASVLAAVNAGDAASLPTSASAASLSPATVVTAAASPVAAVPVSAASNASSAAPASVSPAAPQPQPQPQQQPQHEETCIGIPTNALLHLLRASLAGCTTIHVANVTFLVYPLRSRPQAPSSEPAEDGAGGTTRLLDRSDTASASASAAMLVVAMRRPDSDDGSLARFVQCFVNCLYREEERAGYVGEQVYLMEHIAVLWESGGIEAVINSAPLAAFSHIVPSRQTGDSATSAPVGSPGYAHTTDSHGGGNDDDSGDEDAYYSYLDLPRPGEVGEARGSQAEAAAPPRPALPAASAAGWDATRSLVALRAKSLPNVYTLLAADESPVRLCRELTQLTRCVNYWSRMWRAELAAGACEGGSSHHSSSSAMGRHASLRPADGGLRASQLLSRTARARWLARCCAVLKRPVLAAPHAALGQPHWSGAARAGGPASARAHGSAGRIAYASQGSGPLSPTALGASASSSSMPSFVTGVEVNRLLFLPASFLVAGHAGISPWARPDDLLASPYARMSPCGLITVYSTDALASAAMQKAYVDAVGQRAAELLPLTVVAQCLTALMAPRQVGALYRSLEEALLRSLEVRGDSPAHAPSRQSHIATSTRHTSPALGMYSPAPSLDAAATSLESLHSTTATGQTGSHVLLHAASLPPHRAAAAAVRVSGGLSSSGTAMWGAAATSARGRQAYGAGRDASRTAATAAAAAGVPVPASAMADVAGLDFLAIEVMELLKTHTIIGVEGELFITFTHGDLASAEHVEAGVRHREKHLSRQLAHTPVVGLTDVDSTNTSAMDISDGRASPSSPAVAARRKARLMPHALVMMLLEQVRHSDDESDDACESAEDAWRRQASARATHTASTGAETVFAAGPGPAVSVSPSLPPLYVAHCVWGPACPLCEDLASSPSAWALQPTTELIAKPKMSAGATGAVPCTAATRDTVLAPALLELRFPFLDPAVRASCQRRASRWWWSTTFRSANAVNAAGGVGGVSATSERGAESSPASNSQPHGYRSASPSGHASPISPRLTVGASLTALTAPAFQRASRPWFVKPEMYMAPSTRHATTAVRLYKEKTSVVAPVASAAAWSMGCAGAEDTTDAVMVSTPHTTARATFAVSDGVTSPLSFSSPQTDRGGGQAFDRAHVEGHSSKGVLATAEEDDGGLLLTADTVPAGAVAWLREFARVIQARLDASRQRRLRLCREACRRPSHSTHRGSGGLPLGADTSRESHSSHAHTTPVACVSPADGQATSEEVPSSNRQTPQCSPSSSPFLRYSKRVLPQRTPPSSVLASQPNALLYTTPHVAQEKAVGPSSPGLVLDEPAHEARHEDPPQAIVTPASPPQPQPAALPDAGRVLPVEVVLQVVLHHLVGMTWGSAEGVELEALVRQAERSLRRLPPLLASLQYTQQLQNEYGTSERLAAMIEEVTPGHATKAGTDTSSFTAAAATATTTTENSQSSTTGYYAPTHTSLQLLRAYEVFEALQLVPCLQPYAGHHVQVVPTRLLLHAVVNEFGDVFVPRASAPSTDVPYTGLSRKSGAARGSDA